MRQPRSTRLPLNIVWAAQGVSVRLHRALDVEFLADTEDGLEHQRLGVRRGGFTDVGGDDQLREFFTERGDLETGHVELRDLSGAG